jgi:1-deoxy-D-xylulose-5-phosphate synthase
MATEGLKPYVAIYSTFLQRAYDQVVHDIAIQSLPVRFLIDRSGFVGADGATHAGSFDLSYLCCLPNFIVMAPSSGEELKNMLNFSLSINNKPCAIRYPRDTVGAYDENKPFEKINLGKGKIVQKGKKVAFLNLGTRIHQVKETSKLLNKKNNLQSTIVDMRFAKPIDKQLLKSLLKNHDIFITVEENAIGGFSSQVNNFFLNQSINQIRLLNFFMKDEFIDQSDMTDQYKQSGISPEEIYKKVSNFL